MTASTPNDLLGWIAGNSLPLAVFYGIGIVAAIVLLLQIGLMLLGFGEDHDLDASGHGDGDVGFFSLRSIVAFFVGFGWTGVLAMKGGLGVIGATAAALGVGVLFMAVIFALVRLLYAQRTSGNVRYENAIGQTGRVYLSIPPSSGAGGQIQITFQGQHQTLPAITLAAEPLPTGSTVVVRAIVPPDTLVVEKP